MREVYSQSLLLGKSQELKDGSKRAESNTATTFQDVVDCKDVQSDNCDVMTIRCIGRSR